MDDSVTTFFWMNFGVLGLGVLAFFRYGVPYLEKRYKEWESRVDSINTEWSTKYDKLISDHRDEMKSIVDNSNETHLLSVQAITENSRILQSLNSEVVYLREWNNKMEILYDRINRNLEAYNKNTVDEN